jgi:hypothetical protein
MTLTVTSSLRHFWSIFHTMILVAIIFVASLILFIMILHKPLSMPYVFFISSTRAFSLVLSSRFYAGLLPIVGRPMMKEMSSTSIDTSSSSHTNPLWRTSNNCFTQLFASFPLPKWGILSKFKMPVLARSDSHCFGCLLEKQDRRAIK